MKTDREVLETRLRGMKRRCYQVKDKNYPNYGGRGITICQEWLDDAETFYDWALANGFKRELTIDRIDNSGPYSPANCRWVDMKTQNNNRRPGSGRTGRLFEAHGERRTIKEWLTDRRCHYSRSKIWARMKSGMTFEQAITRPIKAGKVQGHRLVEAFNEFKSVADWSRDSRCKVTRRGLAKRVSDGWNVEAAITREPLATEDGDNIAAKMREAGCTLHHSTVTRRLKRGMSLEQAMSGED